MEGTEGTDQNQLIEESNPDQQENNNNADGIPIKEEQNQSNKTSGSNEEDKAKPDDSEIQLERFKKLRQYIVLCIYSGIIFLAFIIEHYGFGDNPSNFFYDLKFYKYILYAIVIACALCLSALVCFKECLIKTNLLGILLLLLLIIFDGFLVFFTKHLFDDDEHKRGFYYLLSPLLILVCGSGGMICAVLIVRKEVASLIYLLIFNAIFMLISGVIAIACTKKDYQTGATVFGAIAFVISEFTVYSSQYKYVTLDNDKNKKTKLKKETLMYAQPFELNLSILKVLILIYFIIKKCILCCIKCCSKKKMEQEPQGSQKPQSPTESKDSK